MNSRKKIAIIIAVVVIAIFIVAGGLIFYKYQIKSNAFVVNQLMQISSAATMNDSQQKNYNDVKNRLLTNPADYKALFDLAGLKQGLGDEAGAIELYEKLHQEKPEDILPLNNLGSIYFNQKKYQQAEQMYLTILAITPKWLNSYNELYSLYQFFLKDKKNDYEKIILNGIEKYPEQRQNMLSKAAVYYDEIMNNKAKAIEYYEKLLKLIPGDTQIKDRIKQLKS